MKKPSRKPSPNYVRNETTGDVRITPRERLLIRESVRNGRIAALNDIHEKLAVATELFEHHGDGGRTGVYRAVIDVVDYFAGQGIPRATLVPLAAVAASIVDADRGVENRIFKPDRKAGAPPKSVDQLTFEGHLAAVMECCVEDQKMKGERPYIEKAARQAAMLIEGSKWPANPGWITLRELRERVSAAAKHSPDRVVFENLTSSAVQSAKPLLYAKALLNTELVVAPPA